MAANMTGMLVEEKAVIGTGAKHSPGRGQRVGAIGVVAATLTLLLVGSVVLHHRSTSHAAAPAIPRAVTGQQARFLENNTTNLPNAVAAESRPNVVTSEQQRFLESNTITLPSADVANLTSPITTREQQRFWEVNTMLPEGPIDPYGEDLTPLPGHPR